MRGVLAHWQNYLLLIASLAYAGGILLGRWIGLEQPFPPLLYLLFPALLLFAGISSRRLPIPILAIIFLVFGMVQGHRARLPTLADTHIALQLQHGQRVVLVGTLAGLVAERNGISRAPVDVAFIETAPGEGFRKSTGTIILSLKGPWPAALTPGVGLAAVAAIELPTAVHVPGAFNYREYLARKGVYLVAAVDSPLLVQPAADLDPPLTRKVIYAIEGLRLAISGRIEQSLSEPNAALYKALLIGDRSDISPELIETIKRAGILHILAISGMHLGMLAAMIFFLCYWLLRRSETLILKISVRKWAMLLTLPPLLLYTLIAGAQAPVIRSLVMTLFGLGALAANRLHSPLTTLSGAALAILLFEPLALESASFQLSFAAVAAIVLITPRLLLVIEPWTSGLPGPLPAIVYPAVALAAVTVSATCGTLPLMLLHFNRISLVSLPANLLIEPLICLFSLPLGFVSVVFMGFLPDLSTLLLQAGAAGLVVAIRIASIISGPEATQVWSPAPHPLSLSLYYLALLLLCVGGSSWRTTLPCGAALLIGTCMLFLPSGWFPPGHPPYTTVAVLAVGHGSANVIEMGRDRVVIIDGGARGGPGYDCGDRIIAPYLWQRGFSSIDDIIITHDDADHYNGLATVILRFRPRRLWAPHLGSEKSGFRDLLALARSQGVELIRAAPGMIIDQGGETITVLAGGISAEGDRQPWREGMEDDHGLVLRLDSGPFSMLFPGDITRLRERALVESGEHIEATILLSPHHGSSTSNSLPFLKRVNPQAMIFSSAEARGLLFPSAGTMAMVKDLGISAFHTAVDGTVSITIGSDPAVFGIRGYRVPGRSYFRTG